MAGTIYIPDRHKETDREWIFDFAEEFSFAMLVTAAGGVEITNVPTVLDRAGKVWFHLAKGNPQNAALTGGEAVLVFHGPHGYISPSWYEVDRAVPTWNFVAIHMTGRPQRMEDDAAVADVLSRLVRQYETGPKPWLLEAMPADYLRGMRKGIIAYEMALDRVEAKVKLGQERSEADRAGILNGLARRPGERSLWELTRGYYERLRAKSQTQP